MVTTGKPSYDPDHPDYVLSLFSGRQNNEYARVEQYERAKKRRIQRDKSPSSTLNEETRENKDDITTLKSKVNQLMNYTTRNTILYRNPRACAPRFNHVIVISRARGMYGIAPKPEGACARVTVHTSRARVI